jgi:HAD superfamily hydrolase (TIGR01459 family)
MTSLPKMIAGFREIAPNYDAAICDVWGVVHNGRQAYAGACAALEEFRKARGPVLLLSNAPRPGADVVRQLDGYGVPRAAYDAVLTSGDGTRAELMRRTREKKALPVYHIGPDRDQPLIAGLDIRKVSLDEADLILCSGLFDDETETPDDYRNTYARGVARGLTMICANPDLKVERGPKLIFCAGALAEAYEQTGGKVIYFGKPHAPVYDQAFERLNQTKDSQLVRTRILAIGDGLKTDVKGANVVGLDVLLITAGLHVSEFGTDPARPDPKRIAESLNKQQLNVAAAIPWLVW